MAKNKLIIIGLLVGLVAGAVGVKAYSGAIIKPNDKMATESAKEVTVVASNYSFEPKEIRVKLGEKVRINLVNQDGLHDLIIDEFGVSSDKLNSGESTTIEFTANKRGEFEYYCSVGNHRQMGMAGKLIVE